VLGEHHLAETALAKDLYEGELVDGYFGGVTAA